MKPKEQVVSHNPDTGEVGDCFSACIASLLEVETSSVPNFAAAAYPDGAEMDALASEWLRGQGKRMLYTIHVPRGYSIASGPSPRFPDLHHAVVWEFDGKESGCAHDPHPDKAGLEHPEYYIIIDDIGAMKSGGMDVIWTAK